MICKKIIKIHYCLLLKVLLPAAKILQLDYVINACVEYLQTSLDTSNCLSIKAFADLHNCMELMSSSEEFINKYFLYDF